MTAVGAEKVAIPSPTLSNAKLKISTLLIQEAGGSAFVFGGSSGGVLTLDAAAHGSHITKLAVYEPPFVVDDSRDPFPKISLIN